MVQTLQAAAAGVLGKERLDTLVMLTAHNHSGTQAGSHLWRWPQDMMFLKTGSATDAPPKKTTARPLWQSVLLLDLSFSSLYMELPAFQCVPTASCPVPWGAIENSLALSSLLPHQAVTGMGKMPLSR